MSISPCASEIDHMTIRPLYQATDINWMTLEERRDLVIHERDFSLESDIDTVNFHFLYPTLEKYAFTILAK
jgi:hypothetical protein